jgi:hypothetical protein
VVVCLTFVASACDWSQLYGGPGNTSNAVGEGSPTAANVGSLAVEWSVSLGTVDYGSGVSEPVTSGNDLYIATSNYPNGGTLDDFEVAGGPCGSTPTCAPNWVAQDAGSTGFGQLTVVGGRVYAGGGTLEVYDAAGQQGCSGSPKVCQPLWSGTQGAADPVVAGSVLYAAFGSHVLAYPTNGTGCAGTPLVCTPQRTYDVSADADPLGVADVTGPPVVVGHDLYVPVDSSDDVGTAGEVDHFDLSSTVGCSGTPAVCTTAASDTTGHPDRLATDGSDVYVVGSVRSFYPPPDGFPPDNWLWAFHADGTPEWSIEGDNAAGLAVDPNHLWATTTTTLQGFPRTGCSTTCIPTVTAALGASPTAGPVESNGLIYVGTGTTITVFSATGGPTCSGTPAVCQPLAKVSVNGESVTDIVPSNGRLLVVTKATPYTTSTAHLVVLAASAS